MMDPVLQVITVVGTLAAFVCALIYFARWQDSRQRNYMNDIKAEIRESKSDVMAEMKELRDKLDYNSERLSYIEGKLDRAFPDGMTPPGASERKRATG